jgi:hypothetical protein
VGQNCNVTCTGMEPSPGTRPATPRTSRALGLWGKTEAAPTEGRFPTTEAKAQPATGSAHHHLHLCPPAQACSLQTSSDRSPEAATTMLPSAQIWEGGDGSQGMEVLLKWQTGRARGQDLTPLSTLWWLRVKMVLGGSVGTCTCEQRQGQEAEPGPTWSEGRPCPHPDGLVSGRGVQGPQRVSDPCDLRPVAHVERLQEGTDDTQTRVSKGQPSTTTRRPGSRKEDGGQGQAGAGALAHPDKLEAAITVGKDVKLALVVAGPELGPLVGHAEQVGVQLWEDMGQNNLGGASRAAAQLL